MPLWKVENWQLARQPRPVAMNVKSHSADIPRRKKGLGGERKGQVECTHASQSPCREVACHWISKEIHSR